MSHKLAFEALDRTLQDIRENDQLMGGITMVIAGDFRQTLPVIPRSTPADELNACLKASYLWRSVQTLTLSTNMRVYIYKEIRMVNGLQTFYNTLGMELSLLTQKDK